MISIIICSISQEHLENVKVNISATIGTEFELLVYDNQVQKNGLCEVYNDMAAKAKFPYLCFLHEDILFDTDDWGKTIIGLFQDNPDTGVIGVAGGKYKSKAFSGWYSGNSELDFYNIVHRANGVDGIMRQPQGDKTGFHEVVCLDGVFIACRYEIWKEIKFNDKLLKKFHFYDIDFSLRASRTTKVFVTMAIHITHITKGGDDCENWVQEAIKFHDAQKLLLPYYKDVSMNKDIETDIAKVWLDFLKKEKIYLRTKFKWITHQKLLAKPALWYSIFKFLLYEPLRLSAMHKYLRKNRKAI